MKYIVEFKTPDGAKISQEFEADSHWGAAQEAIFDTDILEPLLATGKTKFGAKVRRCSDNSTRSVLVELDRPQAPPATPAATVVAPDMQSDGEVKIPDNVTSGTCQTCGKDKVPGGFTITVPDGSKLCSECSLPVAEEPKEMEGFEEVKEEELLDRAEEVTDEVIEALEEVKEEVKEKLADHIKKLGDEPLPSGLTDEMLACLRDNDLLPKLCEGCGDKATEQDDAGNDLCEDCFLELLEEADNPPAPVEVDPEKRHYLVVYGDHLEPGHEDRVALRVKSPNPRAALTAAEYAVTEQKGQEWVTAFYSVGLTPTIDACDPPEEDKAKKFVEAEAPQITEKPPVVPDDKTYDVNFFLGSQAISTTVEAQNAKEAAGIAANEEVRVLCDHVGPDGMVAAQAICQGNQEDNWGPGVVRVPVEQVVKYGSMSSEQQANAKNAIGITRLHAGPALGLGTADPKGP